MYMIIFFAENGQSLALRYGSSLHSKTESAKIILSPRKQRIDTAKPHGGNQLFLGHSYAIINYCKVRVTVIPFGLYIKDGSLGSNTVINNISNSRLKGIPDVPQ